MRSLPSDAAASDTFPSSSFLTYPGPPMSCVVLLARAATGVVGSLKTGRIISFTARRKPVSFSIAKKTLPKDPTPSVFPLRKSRSKQISRSDGAPPTTPSFPNTTESQGEGVLVLFFREDLRDRFEFLECGRFDDP